MTTSSSHPMRAIPGQGFAGEITAFSVESFFAAGLEAGQLHLPQIIRSENIIMNQPATSYLMRLCQREGLQGIMTVEYWHAIVS